MSKLYIVFTNSDLTEGRGFLVPFAWSYNKYTALRLAKRRGVQGSDADVQSIETIEHLGMEYIPIACVPVEYPTKQDEDLQKQEEERNNAIAKMRELGVTDDLLQKVIGVKG